MSSDTLPWIEKYRPSVLDNIVSHENIIKALRSFISTKHFPNIILYGPAGTGKTSLICACSNELFKENRKLFTLDINASEERGVDVIRSTIIPFTHAHRKCSDSNLSSLKLIILDEADSMTFDAQMILKNVIDNSISTTRFCLVCNCIEKIHSSLISRCVKLRLHPLPPEQIIQRINYICKKENIILSSDVLDRILHYSHGDLRRIINVLQALHTTYDSPKKEISVESVELYLNIIPKKYIESIFDILLSKNIQLNKTYRRIYDLLYGSHHSGDKQLTTNSFSIHELITSINDVLICTFLHPAKIIKSYEKKSRYQTNISFEQLKFIIKKLGTLEYQLYSNVNHKILLSSLISYFILAQQLF